jgi:hypothetical protein
VLVASCAAAAVVATVVGIELGTAQPSGVNRSTPLAISTGNQLVAAVNLAAGDVLQVQGSAVPMPGRANVACTSEQWMYPANPVAGQEVHQLTRTDCSNGRTRNSAMNLRNIQMSSGVENASGTGKVVDAFSALGDSDLVTGTGMSLCYVAGESTYTRHSGDELTQSFPSTTWIQGAINAHRVAASMSSVHGRPAIELTTSAAGRSGRSVHLWVDATSYLPVQEATPWGSGGQNIETLSFLPATAANQALTTFHVPAGAKAVDSTPNMSAPLAPLDC